MIRLTQQREKYGPTIIVEVHDDVTAPELVEVFRAFMLAVRYAPETVDEVLGER